MAEQTDIASENIQASEASTSSPANGPLPTEGPKESRAVDVESVLNCIYDTFREDSFKDAFRLHLDALAATHGVSGYRTLYLMDRQDELSSWHSNRIYKSASRGSRDRPILLVLDNLGGSIEPGYLISKTCKRLAHGKFVVAVPRKAKSAATLLSLGADEIHMGLMSELGPIDPQIGGFPALGMKNALEILAGLACRYPGASTMLSDFINAKLDLRILGYFERINESATQYAERLLSGKSFPPNVTAKSLADHFVNHYKDHSFVIDFDEASSLLGPGVVKHETPEYAFANAVYESFDLIRFALGYRHERDADLTGSASQIRIFDRKKD